MSTTDLNRKIKYSVISSLASKFSTTLIHLISLPIAATSLGEQSFAIYAILTSTIALLNIANIGVAPSLAIHLASAIAKKETELSHDYFNSAIWLTLLISSLLTIIAIITTSTSDLSTLGGTKYNTSPEEIELSIYILIAIFFLSTNISTLEAAQLGHQEQYRINITSSLAGLLTIPTLYIASKENPTIASIILAANTPLILLRTINCILFSKKFLPSTSAFKLRKNLSANLLRQGLQLSMAGGVNNLISHTLPILIAGRICSPSETSEISITINTLILLSGVTSMLFAPLCPAIANSAAQGNKSWAILAYKKLLIYTTAISTGTLLILIFWGEEIYSAWYRNTITPDKPTILWLSIYFVFLTWETAHFTILSGLKKIEKVSLILLLKSIISATLIYFSIKPGHPYIVFLVLASITAALSIPIFLVTKGELRRK